MLEIERVSWLKPRYAVRDDLGHSGTWARRRFKEAMIGELDGERCELQVDGRKRFLLTRSGREPAPADGEKRGRWTITAGDATYDLRRKSARRSEMKLLSGEIRVGSVRRRKRKVACELPPELSLEAQTFIGLLALALWNRAAASSGAAAGSVSASPEPLDPNRHGLEADPALTGLDARDRAGA